MKSSTIISIKELRKLEIKLMLVYAYVKYVFSIYGLNNLNNMCSDFKTQQA